MHSDFCTREVGNIDCGVADGGHVRSTLLKAGGRCNLQRGHTTQCSRPAQCDSVIHLNPVYIGQAAIAACPGLYMPIGVPTKYEKEGRVTDGERSEPSDFPPGKSPAVEHCACRQCGIILKLLSRTQRFNGITPTTQCACMCAPLQQPFGHATTCTAPGRAPCTGFSPSMCYKDKVSEAGCIGRNNQRNRTPMRPATRSICHTPMQLHMAAPAPAAAQAAKPHPETPTAIPERPQPPPAKPTPPITRTPPRPAVHLDPRSQNPSPARSNSPVAIPRQATRNSTVQLWRGPPLLSACRTQRNCAELLSTELDTRIPEGS